VYIGVHAKGRGLLRAHGLIYASNQRII